MDETPKTPATANGAQTYRHRLIALAKWVRRNAEISTLLVIAAGIVAVWAFAELADEVIEGGTQGVDRTLLLLLRTPGDLSDPIGPPYLEEMGRDLTALGGVVVLSLATCVAAGFFAIRKSYGTMLYVLVATGAASPFQPCSNSCSTVRGPISSRMGPWSIPPAFPPGIR